MHIIAYLLGNAFTFPVLPTLFSTRRLLYLLEEASWSVTSILYLVNTEKFHHLQTKREKRYTKIGNFSSSHQATLIHPNFIHLFSLQSGGGDERGSSAELWWRQTSEAEVQVMYAVEETWLLLSIHFHSLKSFPFCSLSSFVVFVVVGEKALVVHTFCRMDGVQKNNSSWLLSYRPWASCSARFHTRRRREIVVLKIYKNGMEMRSRKFPSRKSFIQFCRKFAYYFQHRKKKFLIKFVIFFYAISNNEHQIIFIKLQSNGNFIHKIFLLCSRNNEMKTFYSFSIFVIVNVASSHLLCSFDFHSQKEKNSPDGKKGPKWHFIHEKLPRLGMSISKLSVYDDWQYIIKLFPAQRRIGKVEYKLFNTHALFAHIDGEDNGRGKVFTDERLLVVAEIKAPSKKENTLRKKKIPFMNFPPVLRRCECACDSSEKRKAHPASGGKCFCIWKWKWEHTSTSCIGITKLEKSCWVENVAIFRISRRIRNFFPANQHNRSSSDYVTKILRLSNFLGCVVKLVSFAEVMILFIEWIFIPWEKVGVVSCFMFLVE